MAIERPKAFLIGENALTLIGKEIQVGSRAPDFTILSTSLEPLSLKDSAGKTRILLTVSSLDTPVCDAEMKEFSDRASELEDTEVVVVSVDLPFAQRRWCGAEGVDNLTLGSDHRDVSFGEAYGVLVKGSRTLSRAAFVVDPADKVTYVEYVPDIDLQPDFDAVIQAAHEASSSDA